MLNNMTPTVVKGKYLGKLLKEIILQYMGGRGLQGIPVFIAMWRRGSVLDP